MPRAPQSFLFGGYSIATASSGRSRYGHTFGGPHDRKGTAREDCDGILIHLLHRLDLNDPAVPIAIPGFRWLPFYYCFDLRSKGLGYRLTSDESLVTYFPRDAPDVTGEESWYDDEGFLLQFPRSGITVKPYKYDPSRLEDAYAWAGVFGIGRLSKRDQAAAKKRAARHAEALLNWTLETDDDFEEALSGPFAQGRPDDECLNPGCPNRKKKGRLSTIAIVPGEPVAGVHMFGRWGDDVQLIFQMCELCHTIRVTNQCD